MLQAEADDAPADLMALVFDEIGMVIGQAGQLTGRDVFVCMPLCQDPNKLCPLFMEPLTGG